MTAGEVLHSESSSSISTTGQVPSSNSSRVHGITARTITTSSLTPPSPSDPTAASGPRRACPHAGAGRGPGCEPSSRVRGCSGRGGCDSGVRRRSREPPRIIEGSGPSPLPRANTVSTLPTDMPEHPRRGFATAPIHVNPTGRRPLSIVNVSVSGVGATYAAVVVRRPVVAEARRNTYTATVVAAIVRAAMPLQRIATTREPDESARRPDVREQWHHSAPSARAHSASRSAMVVRPAPI